MHDRNSEVQKCMHDRNNSTVQKSSFFFFWVSQTHLYFFIISNPWCPHAQGGFLHSGIIPVVHALLHLAIPVVHAVHRIYVGLRPMSVKESIFCAIYNTVFRLMLSKVFFMK